MFVSLKPVFFGLAVFQVAFNASSLSAQPLITVVSFDDEMIEVEVAGVDKDETWVIQDSYDGKCWRDLAEVKDGPLRERRAAHVPARLFRVARKEMDSPATSLQKAREKWAGNGPESYWYRYQTFNAFSLVDQLINVKDGSAVEAVDLNTRADSSG